MKLVSSVMALEPSEISPFSDCKPETLKKAEAEGLIEQVSTVEKNHSYSTVLSTLAPAATVSGLLQFPPKFWDEVTAVLFSKRQARLWWVYGLFGPMS